MWYTTTQTSSHKLKFKNINALTDADGEKKLKVRVGRQCVFPILCWIYLIR